MRRLPIMELTATDFQGAYGVETMLVERKASPKEEEA